MCDELGNDEYMEAYILEAGETFLCSIVTKQGCSEKEITFIESSESRSLEEVKSQLTRLNGMTGDNMKSELKSWINQRKRILHQFASSLAKSDEEL